MSESQTLDGAIAHHFAERSAIDAEMAAKGDVSVHSEVCLVINLLHLYFIND